MSVTISIGQMPVTPGEPEQNIDRVRHLIAEAAQRGSDILLLPELWDTGYALDRAAELGSPVDTGRFADIAALAKTHKLHILGSMLEYDDDKAMNTAVCFSPTGDVLGVYRKLHLFRLMDEHHYLTAGESPTLLDLPWGKTGIAICYDLRFPELFRGYAMAEADLVIMPAQWPTSRVDHWQTLIKARAIENQMVLAACNRVGDDDGTPFGGRSVIRDAWGNAIVEAGDQPVLLTAEVDLSQSERARTKIPILKDRRDDVYG